MANVTSTPPPAVGWTPKMVNYKYCKSLCVYFMITMQFIALLAILSSVASMKCSVACFRPILWHTAPSKEHAWLCVIIYSTTDCNTITCNRLVHRRCFLYSYGLGVLIGAEVPLGHVPLTSLGSGTSNYVTADELASTWHKLGIDATNDEVENFIEVCLV